MKVSHYAEGRLHEPIDVIQDWGLNFNLGNVVKYVSRVDRKDNSLEDLKKARDYLNYEIQARGGNKQDCGCDINRLVALINAERIGVPGYDAGVEAAKNVVQIYGGKK